MHARSLAPRPGKPSRQDSRPSLKSSRRASADAYCEDALGRAASLLRSLSPRIRPCFFRTKLHRAS